MQVDPIIQFVYFETTADTNEFISQWDHYARGMRHNQEIRLHHEVGTKKRARYLSEHKCLKGEFKFLFKKERRSARFPEVEMKVRQLGGYSVIQLECDQVSKRDQSKVFVFINNAEFILNNYRQLTSYRHLNIYKAYFENSTYEYILEFFADNNQMEELMLQLKSQDRHYDLGMYKECLPEGV